MPYENGLRDDGRYEIAIITQPVSRLVSHTL